MGKNLLERASTERISMRTRCIVFWILLPLFFLYYAIICQRQEDMKRGIELCKDYWALDVQNRKLLRARGLPITNKNLYIMHEFRGFGRNQTEQDWFEKNADL